MSGRWNQTKPTGSTCDDVESYDPVRESAYFYFHFLDAGKDPLRTFHMDGSVTVTARDERPLRFVQRRLVLTREISEGSYERHL